VNLSYTVPAAGTTVFSVKGLRMAVAPLTNGTSSAVLTATIIAVGLTLPASGIALPVGFAAPSLLSSSVVNIAPCAGSALPAATDFTTFATTTTSSAVRITEASINAFAPKSGGADFGTRILVTLSGYGTSRVFVPDVIVGTSGTFPTSAGGYNSTINSGLYSPPQNFQLLLSRVNGADATGVGGTLAIPVAPGGMTQFSTINEVSMASGSGYVVYEVLDANPNTTEIAQIPVFQVVPPTTCGVPGPVPALSAKLAPASTVSVGTSTDPIPRYMATPVPTDCTQINDCSASYFPVLSVDQTPIQINGNAQGGTRTAILNVSNGGGGALPFKLSVTYQSGSNWLSLSATSGSNNTGITLTANPANLSQGTYGATITVDAGTFGTAAVPVVFNVGPQGVKITGVTNAASYSTGALAPGSYAALFGTNMGGSNVSVTFNGFAATIVYSSATQINLIVPTALGFAPAADVVVTADAGKSDSVKVAIQPNAPGVFNPGIVNFANGSTNAVTAPAARGDFILVFATGLATPVTGPVTVNIGSQSNLVPQFAGAQGTFPGLQQINIAVPTTLPATPNPVPLSICIPGLDKLPVCSNTVNLFIK
jgi:uncharacterized protein (TIGR03437 family)